MYEIGLRMPARPARGARHAQVVRFDLPGTAREFIQSRGRARAPASHMVLLAEEGNTAHAALIEDARRCAPRAARARPLLSCACSPDRSVGVLRRLLWAEPGQLLLAVVSLAAW